MEEDAINQPVNNKFSENFWGDKFNGWEVLYKNLRSSVASVKEFEQYLRDCVTVEDTYVKNLDKLKLQILKFSSDSSFSPIWHNILKDLNHSNSGSHLHFKFRVEELIKEVQNYYDDLRKRKQKIKENESKTQQLVELIRGLALNLMKSKELFYQASQEVEKQTVEVNLTSTPNLAAQITLQKLERKCQSLRDEYLNVIDKYNSIRVEFEQKFTESCNLFQNEEELHLKKMRSFVTTYTQLVAQLNSSRQKNFNDCQQKLNNVFTNEALLQQLIVSKATGQDRPIEAQYLEPNFESADLRSTNRASFSSQNIHRSPTLFDSPDTTQEESKLNQDYDSSTLYSSSVPNPSKTSTKISPNKTVELRKKSDGKSFNILEMFGRSNKTKTELNNSALTKKNGKQQNESLSKSNLSSSYSFLPTFFTSKDEAKSNDTDAILSSKKVVDAVTDTFNKQLKQIDSFEKETIKNSVRSLSTDPMDIKFSYTNSDNETATSSPTKRKKGQIRFELDRPTSPIDLVANTREEKPTGSLLTATSIDNNIIFDNSGLFENLEDYVDSFNSNSVTETSKEMLTKMNDLNSSNRGQIYAFSESSDDELTREINTKNSYDNPIKSEEIEENSETSSDSDNDSDDSDAPKKVYLKIKPLSEVNLATSPELLREISKNLQLIPNLGGRLSKRKVMVQKNSIFETPANESLTSISSINNILPSSSSSLTSDRDAASRSQSTTHDNQTSNLKLDENNNNNNTTANVNIFQMDKPLEAPPLPPLPLNLKQKYHDMINPKYNSQVINNVKSDSSLENLNYDFLSDLSMNNSPITNLDDQNFAKF